ncbi:MAG: class I SAM-dependent DNA methyltransferase [Deltaproteobacteria bacterium]|nr:class I SAM-dependent DNA methyltransferase [Deltaproteobacteria bacterium]
MMSNDVVAFIEKWSRSEAAEQKNKDLFLTELCDVLKVGHPDAAGTVGARDDFVFEKDVRIPDEGGSSSIGRMDLYKLDCFILEAKQGSTGATKKIGTAKRGTGGWYMAMEEAFGQALKYAKHVENPPPFLIVCDIGYCFDIYATFDGTSHYISFPNPQTSRIFFKDLGDHLETLKKIFTDPHSLDPAVQTVKITREVAAKLAELSKVLEADGHHPETVATFLMRCIFTMFAEDVGLLPRDLFTHSIKNYWLPNPPSFPGGVRALWKAMNDGGETMLTGKLLKFNGGLFARQDALALSEKQLRLLLEAAKMDWAEVEPAIFGTLLERALDPKERHSLGAHFTPKAYVERLVRPTIEEPLREDWSLVKAEAMHLVEEDDTEGAKKVVRAFHQKLCSTRVLDPACGSGNFLYVTLEVFKRLEGEVLAMLDGLGDTQSRLDMQTITVNPSQFLGIEIKRWAKEIAEMVLWIGYLQWHLRTYAAAGKKIPVPEPVLRDYGNIECRDAVLAYDEEKLLLDENGKPVTRWDGETTKKHPVTGKDVPDEAAQKPVYQYLNPRKAEWPEADFVVGNPPFVGNYRMRSALGDGYTESLRKTYKGVPDSVDYVMYWWDKAAELTSQSKLRRFGLITTNSLRQAFARKVLAKHMGAKKPISLTYAVPDHPWVDAASGAAVRIAMTVAAAGQLDGVLHEVSSEHDTETDSVEVEFSSSRGPIHPNLKIGANTTGAGSLLANADVSCPGVKLHGSGFILLHREVEQLGFGFKPQNHPHVRQYRNGKDITQESRGVYVIDLFGLTEDEVREKWPNLYQWVSERVKPERDQNKRATYRNNWWIFGEPRKDFRPALVGLDRYIATVETSKHRFFVFLDGDILPDNKLVNIAMDDAFSLGVLSSRMHVVWAVVSGGRLGVGNDPVYVKSSCFEKFPFPDCSDDQKQRIRDLGEALDAHRKARQAEHPKLTITGMYNALQKLRSGEELTKKEKAIHEQGLVSVLKKIHDDLDVAVADAYGWPHDLADEEILERLVALNFDRAEEEKRGTIRWLRPDYQRGVVKLPKGVTEVQEQTEIAATKTPERPSVAPPAAKKQPWPKTLPERISAIRDLIQSGGAAWTAETVARSFKYGQTKSVEPVLESLAAVGVLVGYDGPEGRRWKRVGA